MSATMEIDQFVDFFSIPTIDGLQHHYPPVINLPDEYRPHEIEINYLDKVLKLIHPAKSDNLINYNEPGITEDMHKLAANLVSLLVPQRKTQKSNLTILVFLPGINEIETFETHVKTAFTADVRENVDIHVMHSLLSTEDQKKVFASSENNKLILSTNISESSITIPKVTHVIDFCLTKYQVSCKGSHMSSLITDWATQNNCIQRAGRTGRVLRGTVFRLVRQHFFEKSMKYYPTPEIQSVPLESVILKIKKLDMGSPLKILAFTIDPPNRSQVVEAVLILKEFGGLLRVNSQDIFEYDDGEMTFLGEVMAALPCDIRISKLIMMGYLFSVMDEAIIIGAGLSVQGLFRWTFGNKMDAFKGKSKFAEDSESDLIAILNAYCTWSSKSENKYFSSEIAERTWCREQGVDLKILHEMRLWIIEIKHRLLQLNVKLLPQGHQPLWNELEKQFVLKVIFAGSFGIASFFLPTNNANIDREASSVLNDLNPNRTVYFRNMKRNMQGFVYESQLIESLIKEGVCSRNPNVTVNFDNCSERVYVTFNSDCKTNKIPREMYRAVKLRRMKNGITLNTMDSLGTLKFAFDNDLVERDAFNDVVEKKIYIENPELCPLPTKFITQMRGLVTHVVNAHKFYFRPYIASGERIERDDSYKNIVHKIQRIINHSEVDLISELNRNLKEGDFLLVNRERSGNFERATFVNKIINSSMSLVYLIDSGCTAQVGDFEMFGFMQEEDRLKLKKFPPRFFECRLQEVQPAFLKSFQIDWSNESTNYLSQGTCNERCTIKIYSVVDDVVSVQLFSKDEYGKDICWNDKLVEKAFAEYCDESYRSRMAHDEAQRVSRTSDEVYGPEIEFAKRIVKKNWKRNPVPKSYLCDQNIKLVGPLTPLEVQLHGVAQHQKGYITIDGSSVNQILLNDNSRNSLEKFCVAADVYFSCERDQIKIRETTVMPSVIGLPVVLALIFCPTAQIRRNRDKTHYASIITGLGADKNNKSYFSERDCLLNVDFDLTNDEIAAINHLRLAMSHLLFTDTLAKSIVHLVDGQREITLRKIKNLFIDVMNIHRNQMGVEGIGSFEWNVDQNQNIPTLKDTQGNRAIYQLIETPILHEMNGERKRSLMNHCKELEKLAANSRNPDQECKLCYVYLENYQDLKFHLMSKMHINSKACIFEKQLDA
jgi:ATP-dependent RNA helicase TDRD9